MHFFPLNAYIGPKNSEKRNADCYHMMMTASANPTVGWLQQKTFFYNLKGANSKDNSCKGPEDQVIQT